jgi:biotin-(acetyl-CoA carboxylase) ligase
MIGKTIFELDRVDSTNAYANKVLAKGELDEGTVIWAHEQFAGRGQQNHQWISEAGKNLTFTVVLKPIFLAPDQQFLLNKAISLGALDFIRASMNQRALLKSKPAPNRMNPIVDSLNSLGRGTIPDVNRSDTAENDSIPGTHNVSSASGNLHHEHNNPFSAADKLPETTIKWPNDIYLGNQKIGGILIEHKIMGTSIEHTLAGIGLNINQTQFSSEIPNPVSLIHLLRNEIALREALQAVCRYLDLRYLTLSQNNTEKLDHDYHNSLLGFNQWRNFTIDGALLEGKICGVDDLGRLLVETRNGEVLRFNHGEIEW